MFKRPHHQLIGRILEGMNASFLHDTQCLFAGGTAIALQLDEYRESVDIDFLCADRDGYRALREAVFAFGIKGIFTRSVEIVRDIRADQYGVRTILAIDDQPIKFEIIREDRIAIEGGSVQGIPVPCLSRTDLFAEKLLANADRYADKSTLNRDIIDLAVMEKHWGAIPEEAWKKAAGAYGDAAAGAYKKAKELLCSNPAYLKECLDKMGVDAPTSDILNKVFAPPRRAQGLTSSPAFWAGRMSTS